MERLHEMLPQDEIFLCGLALLAGLVTGAVARCLVALAKRRTS